MKANHLKSYLLKELERIVFENNELPRTGLEIQHTREGFVGDYTLVIFPLVRHFKMKPEEVGDKIGKQILEKSDSFTSFNVVKGFLNLELSSELFQMVISDKKELVKPIDPSENIWVEYSSPNTNKPLHLGHVRNNLLGFSVARILEAAGKNVTRVQLVNDRGIHICKSMVAYQKFGEGKTPESLNKKGDHFVGDFYVKFDKAYREQVKKLIGEGAEESSAKKQAPILLEAEETLRNWEKSEPNTMKLWKEMNEWVYAGFEKTYKRLGVYFDEYQYESDTYLLGKELVKKGLKEKVFFKKEDGSVWCDLTEDGLDEKLILRSDGTSVYMTQDIGTAVERIEKNKLNSLIYTVGNEQDYHFKVLFLILDKLGFSASKKLHHLSYAMVDLPDGKMKSREGNVVDADDLMEQMHDMAKEIAIERGRLEGLDLEEKNNLYEKVGLGALKYFLLKVDPKKRILFNPKESVDFQGNTGPFIQYAYARIRSLITKAEDFDKNYMWNTLDFEARDLLRWIDDFPEVIQKAADDLNPSLVANYVYELVKKYNHFYQTQPILKAETEVRNFRLHLSSQVGETIKKALFLLGIDVIEQM